MYPTWFPTSQSPSIFLAVKFSINLPFFFVIFVYIKKYSHIECVWHSLHTIHHNSFSIKFCCWFAADVTGYIIYWTKVSEIYYCYHHNNNKRNYIRKRENCLCEKWCIPLIYCRETIFIIFAENLKKNYTRENLTPNIIKRSLTGSECVRVNYKGSENMVAFIFEKYAFYLKT